MPKIAVKNLVVTYQTRKTTNTVISDLSVAFPSNKISVIIGESGSGKSTLIKIIAGVLPLNAGEVYFDDAVVTYLPPRERDISYVNQDLVLYPKKNVFHNIAFPLEVASIPVEEIKQRVYETAEVFGLTPLLTRKIKELSLGQAQKVLLAKAMVQKPPLYLFDEPFSNLDKPLSHRLCLELKKTFYKNEDTVIFISHDIHDALSLADYLYVMEEGKIIACGEPAALLKSQNPKVREYFKDL